MTKTTYEHQASDSAQQLLNDIFAIGRIGYVALCCGQEIVLRLAPGIDSKTSAETNFYEELFVNPALLKLASQRGELDCGGLNYIAVGYGDFIQLIMLMKVGHISMGISRNQNAGKIAESVCSVLHRHGQVWEPPRAWLLKTG